MKGSAFALSLLIQNPPHSRGLRGGPGALWPRRRLRGQAQLEIVVVIMELPRNYGRPDARAFDGVDSGCGWAGSDGTAKKKNHYAFAC